MRAYVLIYGLIVFLVSGICSADNGIKDGGADQRGFIKGSAVTVFLNYDQFVSTQMAANNPSLTQKNLESSVRMVIDRWAQVTGLNLTINYGGTTTNTDPGEGEVIIGASVDDPSNKGRFAAASRSYTDDVTNGTCYIAFYRRDSNDEFMWHVFNFKDYPSGAIFFQAVLMHEFGHCLGLQHNENSDGAGQTATLRTVMQSGPTLHASYGPYIEDVEDVIAMYGSRPNVQFDVVLSTNNGLSWNSINSDIPKLGTSQTPVLNRDEDRMMMFLTNLSHHPAFITANNQGQSWSRSPTQFNDPRSLYGTTGSGSGNEYMMAWVDPDQGNYVTIVYTNDAGSSWVDRSAGFRAASTPAIRKVDANTWVICYLYLDADTYKNENGRILSRVSTDDGVTWGPATELASGMRAIGGVTVTSLDRSHLRVGFVRTSDGDDRWTTTITTMDAHINSNNILVRSNWVSNGGQTSTSDASFTTTSRVFVQGYQTPAQRLTSCNVDFATAGWPTCAFVNPFSYHGIPPAVAGKTSSNFVYMVKEK